MRIVNWICGIFALAMLLVFLGKYAVSIGSIPFWIIMLGVLALPVIDLVKSMSDSDGADEGRDSGGG